MCLRGVVSGLREQRPVASDLALLRGDEMVRAFLGGLGGLLGSGRAIGGVLGYLLALSLVGLCAAEVRDDLRLALADLAEDLESFDERLRIAGVEQRQRGAELAPRGQPPVGGSRHLVPLGP